MFKRWLGQGAQLWGHRLPPEGLNEPRQEAGASPRVSLCVRLFLASDPWPHPRTRSPLTLTGHTSNSRAW